MSKFEKLHNWIRDMRTFKKTNQFNVHIIHPPTYGICAFFGICSFIVLYNIFNGILWRIVFEILESLIWNSITIFHRKIKDKIEKFYKNPKLWGSLYVEKWIKIVARFSPFALKNQQRVAACRWNNTLWAFRASFEIRHLRRLSLGSADPSEYSRS